MCAVSSLQAADAPQLTYETPEAAAQDPQFAIQGEYTADGKGIQVVAMGDGKYRIVTYTGGLPGAGWDEKTKTPQEGDDAAVKAATDGAQRVDRESATAGAKPPQGAVVLFDGTKESLEKHWKEGAEMTDDGLLKPGVTSIEAFQNFSLHMEFRTPYMPKSTGQARGNSGLYIHGRYECQILDSFGLAGENNECGGIYSIARPRVNMCFPPLRWQTYDIDFTAPLFDADGKKTKNAIVTIKHNGVVIHENLELPTLTPGGVLNAEDGRPGPVFLQDHGNPVRFRNIWVVAKP
jgi:hypothetical protein